MTQTVSKSNSETGQGTGQPLPEYARDPVVLQLFGLKRATLRTLEMRGKIRGCLLHVQGTRRGVRVWDLNSIRSFIESQMKGGAE